MSDASYITFNRNFFAPTAPAPVFQFLIFLFYLSFLQPDSETQLLTIQFEWNGVLKSVSSTMVGVSPEFEIALYTLCYFVGGEDNYVQLGPYNVNIKCYRFGDKIGSVFPIAEC